jgi:ATP adenylyltransferase
MTQNAPAKTSGCVFCDILNNRQAMRKFILRRAEFNCHPCIYPYGTGHLMILPFEHIPDLDKADKKITDEMMDLTKRSQTALEEIYHPDGFNIGMNLGKAAGAGVAGHFHMHILPRWFGDVNFITTFGQTRTMPESLHTTYEKLKGRI